MAITKPLPNSIHVPWDYRLPFVLRNVVRRWRRSLAATLGVGVALGVVIALLGLSNGSRYLLVGEYGESGIDLYLTTRGGKVAVIQPGDSPGTLRDPKLLVNQLRTLPGVRRVIGTLQGAVSRQLDRGPDGRRDAQLWPAHGVWGDATQVPGMIELREGRWFTQNNEVVVGNTLASAQNVKVNDSITLNDRRFRVVGIGRLKGVGYNGVSNVFLDYDSLRSIMQQGDMMSVVYADTTDPAATAEAAAGLGALEIKTAAQVQNDILAYTSTQLIFYYGVSILALGIAALFVGNVLTTSVNERRPEFATLRAIGIPSRTVVLVVAVEAIVIAGFAFLLGVLVAALLGEGMNLAVGQALGVDRIYIVDMQIFLQVFAISMGLGVVAALLPARAALKVQPAEALREAA